MDATKTVSLRTEKELTVEWSDLQSPPGGKQVRHVAAWMLGRVEGWPDPVVAVVVTTDGEWWVMDPTKDPVRRAWMRHGRGGPIDAELTAMDAKKRACEWLGRPALDGGLNVAEWLQREKPSVLAKMRDEALKDAVAMVEAIWREQAERGDVGAGVRTALFSCHEAIRLLRNQPNSARVVRLLEQARNPVSGVKVSPEILGHDGHRNPLVAVALDPLEQEMRDGEKSPVEAFRHARKKIGPVAALELARRQGLITIGQLSHRDQTALMAYASTGVVTDLAFDGGLWVSACINHLADVGRATKADVSKRQENAIRSVEAWHRELMSVSAEDAMRGEANRKASAGDDG